ncbi:hypothetical protein ACFQX6_04335 [Streptosporangium lutulentum]
MTANKHFKHRVRERARRTGESYTAALRHLRRIDAQEHVVHWQRIENPNSATPSTSRKVGTNDLRT